MNHTKQLSDIIKLVIENDILKKAVFSMPSGESCITEPDNVETKTASSCSHSNVKKAEASLFSSKDGVMVCINYFTTDNKCVRKNYKKDTAMTLLEDMALRQYKRTNIITDWGEAAVMVSSKGKVTVINKLTGTISSAASTLPLPSHNKEKNYILSGKDSVPFLYALGICNEDGRVFDKKMAKYRQINKFLESVEDVYPRLPSEGELIICDFCCGKSYLTFAVYHYLNKLKKRTVKMYGVDLKSDVIDFCRETAKKLGYDGMTFINQDIYQFNIEKTAHMVISLHACDIATDIVLINAVRLGAKVILSTPCCHHEVNNQLSSPQLNFITRHSILKQKLADCATDSLRALMLEACGYEVSVFELIDPEETPKNVMIKAIYKNTHDSVRMRAYLEYEQGCKFLGIRPFISNLTPNLKQDQ